MIEVITMMHNEEMLAPLFLLHYWQADRITVILNDCSDMTAHYLTPEMKCEVHQFKSGDLNDVVKAQVLSEYVNRSPADIRIVVDADEFVFGDLGQVREGEVYEVSFFEVFRHETDKDIDQDAFPLQQRTHGNQIEGECFGQKHFKKPVVFGRGVVAQPCPGNHALLDKHPAVKGVFQSAHWAMADPALAIARRLRKKERMSQFNKTHGLTSHDWHITRQEIVDECSKHLQDPICIKTEREFL